MSETAAVVQEQAVIDLDTLARLRREKAVAQQTFDGARSRRIQLLEASAPATDAWKIEKLAAERSFAAEMALAEAERQYAVAVAPELTAKYRAAHGRFLVEVEKVVASIVLPETKTAGELANDLRNISEELASVQSIGRAAEDQLRSTGKSITTIVGFSDLQADARASQILALLDRLDTLIRYTGGV
jgi:hypothetical protein